MTKVLRYLGQIVAYVAFASVLAVFATEPKHQSFPSDRSQIKLSINHAAKHKGECRRLTPEEIAALPPNMRKPMDCPRERLPLHVELELDGELLYRESVPPSGLARDGTATVYKLFAVEPGNRRIVARLRDSARGEGFDYEGRIDVELKPQQNFVIDFKADLGGFVFM